MRQWDWIKLWRPLNSWTVQVSELLVDRWGEREGGREREREGGRERGREGGGEGVQK